MNCSHFTEMLNGPMEKSIHTLKPVQKKPEQRSGLMKKMHSNLQQNTSCCAIKNRGICRKPSENTQRTEQICRQWERQTKCGSTFPIELTELAWPTAGGPCMLNWPLYGFNRFHTGQTKLLHYYSYEIFTIVPHVKTFIWPYFYIKIYGKQLYSKSAPGVFLSRLLSNVVKGTLFNISCIFLNKMVKRKLNLGLLLKKLDMNAAKWCNSKHKLCDQTEQHLPRSGTAGFKSW